MSDRGGRAEVLSCNGEGRKKRLEPGRVVGAVTVLRLPGQSGHCVV